MTDGETIVGVAAYPYAHEILVEVTARDADDVIVVHSYPFEPGEDGTATPVEGVPERHREAVTRALAEKGYEPDADLADATR